jgi:hypothetical protein
MPETDGPRKKVLVIANLLHASPRIPRIVKLLPQLGWSPTVITPKVEVGSGKMFNAPPKEFERLGIRMIEAGKGRPYEIVKNEGSTQLYRGIGKRVADRMDGKGDGRMNRLLEKYYWRIYLTLNFPDVERRWKVDAIDAAEEVLRSERFDLLLNSSSPVITHIICNELKKRHGIPWIAEYRDLWTLNHNYQLGPIMKIFDRRLELGTVGNADAIVTVTDELAGRLREMFPGKNVISIPTGFDRDEMPDKVPLTKTFTMTYTGQFYPGGNDPYKVVDCVSELIEDELVERKRMKIRFYGPVSGTLKRYAEQKGVDDVVSQHGVVTREEALLRQMESQALLFMNWELPDKGTTSLKLIEYFFSGRPVLLTGGAGDNLMARTVLKTGAGKVVVSREEIKAGILEYYSEYMERGEVSFHGIAEEIEKFNSKHMAAAYAMLMESVSRTKPVVT